MNIYEVHVEMNWRNDSLTGQFKQSCFEFPLLLRNHCIFVIQAKVLHYDEVEVCIANTAYRVYVNKLLWPHTSLN